MSIFESGAQTLEQAANSGTLGIIGAILIAVCGCLILIVLYLIGEMIFEKIDEEQGTKESGSGLVVELIYTHANSTMTNVANIPVPLGDTLQANYVRGRYTGNVYLTEVY